MKKDIKPLYRKVNTRARHVHHQKGGEARHDRHTKKGMSTSMKQGKERGLDYTPLMMFLLSKVGQDWDKVASEAIKRLPSPDVLYGLVGIDDNERREVIRMGESSLYSGLYVASDNTLQKVNPNLHNEDFTPSCDCCTHTFNGKVLIKKFVPYHQLTAGTFRYQ